jgi:hypothetical protein
MSSATQRKGAKSAKGAKNDETSEPKGEGSPFAFFASLRWVQTE